MVAFFLSRSGLSFLSLVQNIKWIQTVYVLSLKLQRVNAEEIDKLFPRWIFEKRCGCFVSKKTRSTGCKVEEKNSFPHEWCVLLKLTFVPQEYLFSAVKWRSVGGKDTTKPKGQFFLFSVFASSELYPWWSVLSVLSINVSAEEHSWSPWCCFRPISIPQMGFQWGSDTAHTLPSIT